MRFLAFALLVLVVAGCAPKRPPTTRPAPYVGPTLALPDLLAALQQRGVAQLRAAGDFEARFVDERGRAREVNGQATLMYRAPGQLRLVGNKDLAGRVFDLGTDGDAFWLALLAGGDKNAFVGTVAGAQASAELPLRPDALAAALGLVPPPVDALGEPTPLLRFNPDADAYMLTWHRRAGDRFVVEREAWYDRATLQPRWSILFDATGRPTARAQLGDYASLADGAGEAPRFAAILFPQTGSRMTLRFDDLRRARGGAPNARSFAFDPERAGVDKIVDLDAPAGP